MEGYDKLLDLLEQRKNKLELKGQILDEKLSFLRKTYEVYPCYICTKNIWLNHDNYFGCCKLVHINCLGLIGDFKDFNEGKKNDIINKLKSLDYINPHFDSEGTLIINCDLH